MRIAHDCQVACEFMGGHDTLKTGILQSCNFLIIDYLGIVLHEYTFL
jgi:hypothetical protein